MCGIELPNDEVSDTTDAASSNAANYKKIMNKEPERLK
jgi:hypothetical protein